MAAVSWPSSPCPLFGVEGGPTSLARGYAASCGVVRRGSGGVDARDVGGGWTAALGCCASRVGLRCGMLGAAFEAREEVREGVVLSAPGATEEVGRGVSNNVGPVRSETLR